ncbi:ninjurin-2-like [Stegodyphus dumicola]|uniref:ninjurin-2-like n=1 Tax=Stegodyphus dumicola TaxID=202533 RepID=UPI0015AB3FAE|nr:ninjurin-2-like [Stegodyphus dumicola]
MTRREREGHDKCPLDANIYATRKTVAQGMMDIALLTANASQLKHVLATADTHDYYLISLVLIGSSMVLQILVGILLVVVGRWNINNRKEQNVANVTNNIIVILIFLITVVNVLITAFGDEDTDDFPNPSHWSEPRKELMIDDTSRLERDLKATAQNMVA